MPDGSRGFTAGRGRRLAQTVASAPGHALPDALQLGDE
jgi:hypothetical protein